MNAVLVSFSCLLVRCRFRERGIGIVLVNGIGIVLVNDSEVVLANVCTYFCTCSLEICSWSKGEISMRGRPLRWTIPGKWTHDETCCDCVQYTLCKIEYGLKKSHCQKY